MQNDQKIKENVAKVFADFPETKTVYATSDGQVFLREDRARLHATPKGNVYPFNRADFDAKPEPAKADVGSTQLNATKTIAAIQECTTLEELKAYESDDRKTVLEALAKRKDQLTKELETQAETVTATSGTEATDTSAGGADESTTKNSK